MQTYFFLFPKQLLTQKYRMQTDINVNFNINAEKKNERKYVKEEKYYGEEFSTWCDMNNDAVFFFSSF